MARKSSKVAQELKTTTPSKNIFGAVRRLLQRTDSPLWWVIVITLLITPLISIATTLINDNLKRAGDARSQQIQSLVDSMSQFYAQAVVFSSEVQDTKKAPAEMRNALTKNLGEQFARLNLVEPLLPAGQQEVLKRYREAILKMQNTLRTVDGPEQLGQFLSDASKLLVARNRLNEVLLQMKSGKLNYVGLQHA